MPATEELLGRFQAANTQVLGVSIDSIHCHANWGVSLGGVSFPLLADFQPKGAVAASYGLYLEDYGITDRATVIIDAGGTIQHISAVTPAGSRDIGELAALCEQVNNNYDGPTEAPNAASGLGAEATLYVKSACGFSLRALNARANLHAENAVAVKNITDDQNAAAELEKLTGRTTAPCLVVGNTPLFESDAILEKLSGTLGVL